MSTVAVPESVRNLGLALAAVAAAVLIGLLLVAISGKDFGGAVSAFVSGMFDGAYAIGASLNRSIAFALVALGFVFANRANLVNVGGEGQMALGGICATAMALYGGAADLPFGLAWILPLLAGGLGGALWGGIAGALKVRRGTNEVISTLLLDFVGTLLVYWCVQSTYLLRKPQTSSSTLPESAQIPDPTQLPMLTGDPSSPLHVGLPIAVVLAVVVWVVLKKTPLGMRLRAIGLNPLASRRAGVPVARDIMVAMLVSGGFAGLAGAMMILGEQWYLSDGFTSGYGFDGLVVGLLARGSIPGVLLAALFFGFIRSGGMSMQMMSGVPSSVVIIIQGLVVVFIAGASRFSERRA